MPTFRLLSADQAPNTGDGADDTNPHDKAGPDAMHTDKDSSRDNAQPIDE